MFRDQNLTKKNCQNVLDTPVRQSHKDHNRFLLKLMHASIVAKAERILGCEERTTRESSGSQVSLRNRRSK